MSPLCALFRCPQTYLVRVKYLFYVLVTSGLSPAFWIVADVRFLNAWIKYTKFLLQNVDERLGYK